jgi:hypothetical protein
LGSGVEHQLRRCQILKKDGVMYDQEREMRNKRTIALCPGFGMGNDAVNVCII